MGKPFYSRTAGGVNRETFGNIVYTPPKIADFMVKTALIHGGDRVLEPSYGDGAIINAIMKHTSGYTTPVEIVGYEIDPTKQELHTTNIQLYPGLDFLTLATPEYEHKRFDRIIMNPPWTSKEKGKFPLFWDFLTHCFDYWLKQDGKIVALLPDYGIFNSEYRKVWMKDKLSKYITIPKTIFTPQTGSVCTQNICVFEPKATQCLFKFLLKTDLTNDDSSSFTPAAKD